MRRRSGRVGLALALLVAQVAPLAAAPAHAATPPGRPFSVFGPTDYERLSGSPEATTSTFSVLNPSAPYTLDIDNGGNSGQFAKLVSSGTITLNGTVVVSQSDFNQTATTIDKSISPLNTNQLSVDLGSATGSGLTLQVTGYDSDPPTITATASPSPNPTGWNDTNVTVSFTCADKTSGVATCPGPVAVTTEGANQTISGTATDKAGNTASTSITVNIDKTPPVASITSPSAGTALNTKTPQLTASVSDALSGVSSVQFQISPDGTTWSAVGAPLTAAPYQATVSAGLADGTYQARVLTSDVAGNQAMSAAVKFVVDTAPPTVSVSQPVEGAITDNRTLAATATDALSGVASVQFQTSPDGTTWTNVGTAVTTAPYQASLPTTLADGAYQARAIATDLAGNAATSAAVHFTLETTAPLTTITTHPDTSTSQTTATFAFSANQSGTTFMCALDSTPPAPCTSPVSYANLAVGTHVFSVLGTDPAGIPQSQPATFTWSVAAANVMPVTGPPPGTPPSDPSTLAPSVDPSVPTTLYAASQFLYGPNGVQTGVLSSTIQPTQVAVIRGLVQAAGGSALPGVTVTIAGHPEFGQTISRTDGAFDLVVNGGGTLIVNYAMNGYLPAQRPLQVAWQDYTSAPEVSLVPLDTQVTAVDLSGSTTVPIQVARGTQQTDRRGVRQATVLFPSGTTAQAVLPGGGTQLLSTLHVRATEYTVGDNGSQRMPAPLPPTTGYTYAAEFSADEAFAAGAISVQFSQPVPVYVDNFLNLPTGWMVPSGYYDSTKSEWVPAPNGQVIKILSVTGGTVTLDLDGSGQAASTQALAALGVTSAELQELATLYQAGQSLWRVPVHHFSSFDFNEGICPSDGAQPAQCPPGQAPNQPTPKPDVPPDCVTPQPASSTIGCESQSFGEDIAITGTPYKLHYESDRLPGRRSTYQITIPVSGASVPAGLQSIDLQVSIAGENFKWSFAPSPNLSQSFTWDGKDAYGRVVQGAARASIQIGYTYFAAYIQPAKNPLNTVPNYNELFGHFSYFGTQASTTCVPVSIPGCTITLYENETVWLGHLGTQGVGLGGWTIDVNHVFDGRLGVLYLGDGRQRSNISDSLFDVISTSAGTGLTGDTGDNGPAASASLTQPSGIAAGADGSLYIADTLGNRVRRIAPDGTITTVAGTGATGFGGDGGVATQTAVDNPVDVALAPDGSLYIVEWRNNRIRRVDSRGVITTFAGTGTNGFSGDGGPATAATLNNPQAVAIGPDGSVYIADTGNNRLRRVTPDGIIDTVAGNGQGCCLVPTADGSPAAQAPVGRVFGMAVSRDGTLYFADPDFNEIRSITTDGMIHRVAGNGQPVGQSATFSGDGGLAVNAQLSRPTRVALGQDGTIYFVDWLNARIRAVSPDGIITSLAGSGTMGGAGDGGPATAAQIIGSTTGGQCSSFSGGLSGSPDGTIYLADMCLNRVRHIWPTLPAVYAKPAVIASDDGSRLYSFDAMGRHLKTIDALTGATLLQFSYDSAGRLASITDGDNNTTTIQRDASGAPTAIVSPYGQQTTLTIDANGFLASVADPAGNTIHVTSSSDGLLQTYTGANGNEHPLIYDSTGRLIKDPDPAGGSFSLTRTDRTSGYSVALTSALGRTTQHGVDSPAAGGQTRTLVDSAGLTSQTATETNGVSTTTSSDGSKVVVSEGPDPRFGMVAPVHASVTETTPSGLARSSGQSVTAALSNSSDPSSLTQQTTKTTVNGQVWTSAFTAGTRTFTDTSPVGRTVVTTVDTQGRPLQSQTGALLPTTYVYDSHGRVSSATQGSGASARTTQFTYNTAGQLSTITDPLGSVTRFAYDAAGRVTAETLPDQSNVAFTYDANGNITSVTPPGRSPHTFTYDAVNDQTSYVAPDAGNGPATTTYSYNADHQLTSLVRPGNQTVSLGYDAGGRLQSVTLGRGARNYAYDAKSGNLTSVTDPSGITLSFTYDGPLPTGSTWSGAVAGSVSATYDTGFRVSSISVNGANPIAYQYDPDNLVLGAGNLAITRDPGDGLITATSLGGVTDSATYDSFGELATYTANNGASALLSDTYTYDALGRIAQKQETIGGITHTYAYGYDPNGRLVSVSTDGTVTSQYSYDSNGNRLTATSTAGTVTGTYDAQDRLTQYGATTYTYNAAGDLTSKTVGGQTTSYVYDELGNLIHVGLPNGSAIDYVIDGMGRRVGKKVNGVLTEGFLYQNGLHPIAQLDGNNNVVSRFVYGTGANVPDYMIQNGVTYRMISDRLGSPVLVLNTTTGQVAEQITYDEFGNVLQDSNPGFQPFGFAGGLYDRDSGLVHFGVRDYDAAVGRWLTKDPLGFGGEDTNLYSYVVDDPVNWVDPPGLFGFGATVGGSIEGGYGPLGSLGATGSAGWGLFSGARGLHFGKPGAGVFATGGAFAGVGFALGRHWPEAPGEGPNLCPVDGYYDSENMNMQYLRTAVGAYAGIGAGEFITNAASYENLKGLSETASVNVPLLDVGFQLSTASDGTWMFSVTFGPGLGGSASAYPTSTVSSGYTF